jgi:large subunit ribosomal protein L4
MGSTRKMWRQKGLGRARVGSKRNPIWVGGGITHPPKPRSYRKKLSKKARKTALKSALLAKLRDGELKVVTDLDQEAPRTREMAAVLRALEAPCNCLVVLPAANETTWKSLRNLPEVSTTVVREMNAYETLRRRYVVMTKTAFEALPEEMK